MCADEVGINGGMADIVAFTKEKHTIEVEVKVRKSDLLVNELKKEKHQKPEGEAPWTTRRFEWMHQFGGRRPNRFYFCVPDYLLEDALALSKSLNKKYGVILYKDIYTCTVVKPAYKLHEDLYDDIPVVIGNRLCNKLVVELLNKHDPDRIERQKENGKKCLKGI